MSAEERGKPGRTNESHRQSHGTAFILIIKDLHKNCIVFSSLIAKRFVREFRDSQCDLISQRFTSDVAVLDAIDTSSVE